MNIVINEVVENIFTVTNMDETKIAEITFMGGVFCGCEYNVPKSSMYTLLDWEFLVKVGNVIMEKQWKYNEEKKIVLNENYWDCECEHNYIHNISEDYCPECRILQLDQPNARANEVEALK